MTLFQVSLLASILAATTCLGHSQHTSPTLEETGAFLVSQIDKSESFSRGNITFRDGSQLERQTWFTSSFSITGCTGEYLVHLKGQDYSHKDWAWHDSQDVDLDKERFNAVTFLMASSKVEPHYPGTYSDPPVYEISIAGRKGLHVLTSDKAMADRLFKAFNGLAELCGAKKEAY